MNRRTFLSLLSSFAAAQAAGPNRPNVILAMADDQGWADTSYNGNRILTTPNLDDMARRGVRFNRFYSGAPVCSPTRGSVLTGRHPFRYGVFFANADSGADSPSKYLLPTREMTLAEMLQVNGYTCGHFGKWHLGDFAGSGKSAPTDHGFDDFLSTTRKVTTMNPDGYWSPKGRQPAMEGDDSRIIMDAALTFMEQAVISNRPFFAVIWFHAPHEPFRAALRHRAPYSQYSERTQHYYGAIASLDEQMGRLREALRRWKVEQDTMLWYTSDNGPEGDAQSAEWPGNSGPFRGRKRSLFEGGIRVPGLLEWPAKYPSPRTIDAAASTSDYLPTIAAALGLPLKGSVDGVNLLPILDGRVKERTGPIGFETINDTRGSTRLAWIEGNWKLLSNLDGSEEFLYDVVADPAESVNLIAEKPALAQRLRANLERWRALCTESRKGL